MTKLADLTEADRLLVIAGTLREYDGYLDVVAWHDTIPVENVRRFRYISDLRGDRGPNLYYVCIGTWKDAPREPGLIRLLAQCGAQELDI